MSFTNKNENNKGKERYVPDTDSQPAAENDWSPWKWDNRGYYTSYRIDSTGATQWAYKSPDPQETSPSPNNDIPRYSPYPSQDLSTYSQVDNQNFNDNQTLPPSNQLDLAPRPPVSKAWSYQNVTWAQGLNTANTSYAPSGSYNSWLHPGTGQQGSLFANPYNYADPATFGSMSQRMQNLALSPQPNTFASGGFSREAGQVPSDGVDLHPDSKLIQDYSEDILDDRYKVVPPQQSRTFWRAGRVFMMLWSEPAGQKTGKARTEDTVDTHISKVKYGEEAYSEIRRFVVVQDRYGCCICHAIHTYSGQATLKPKLPNPENHAIIYTSKQPPLPHSRTLPDGTIIREQLIIDEIKVNGTDKYPEGQLNPKSRIDFTKIYTVEKNVRVLNVGVVNDRSMQTLEDASSVKMTNQPITPTRSPYIRQGGYGRPPKSSDSHEASRKEKRDELNVGAFVDVPRTSSGKVSTQYEHNIPSSSRMDSQATSERPSRRRRDSVVQQSSSARREQSPPTEPGPSSRPEPKQRRRHSKR